MKEISTELVHFIFEHIDSIEQLEVLLLLLDNPARAWTCMEINDVIRSDLESIKRRIDQLVSLRLVKSLPDANYCYQPDLPEDSCLVSELASAYRERRTRIVELIYSKPKRGLHNFSSAFVVVRKEPKDG